MGGWNLFWGLLNFAILAAALWFIGRKLVVKMFTGRRDAIAEELGRSEQADKNALELEAKLGQNDTLVQEQCEEILRRAQEQAEEIRLEGQQLQRKSLEQAANQSLSEERMLRHRLRQELNRKAADDITTAAAELIMGEEFAASRSRMSAEFGAKLEKVFRLSFAEKAVCAQTGLVEARLACAEEPSEALAQQVRETILARMQSVNDQARLELSLEAEPELIAGGRLYLGDTVFDGSVQGMLRMVEKRIANNTDLDNGILESVEEILRSPDMEIDVFQTGHVVSLSDGICHVAGVSDAMYGELLDFAGDLRGVVMDLERDYVGVAMLGNYDKLQEGAKVYRTGRIVEVPVGEKLLGRIVDALGRPIDGGESLETEHSLPIEGAAPGVIQRKSVGVPMQTGIKAIDALVPIGRGQRELIIGDRQTGKTSIALDTIINQKGKDMICIYVAIGQKESSVAGFVEKLKEHGAMDYTIVVCASASESAPMLYIAPYAGTAMGEYFMNKGRDVLIVYDDLSKHAVAYREISLLLHRPPGREAYPGDIFYLHSRLLERAARLSEEYGGGSMTALPIVETQAGDISSYIPTNVISITDGQVFLETELFNAGMRPAINVGLSVSRVGGSAQLPAMKQVSGRMRMDLAQYRELAAFSQFGSELDKATLAALTRGERMTELLKQPQYSPMEASDQVVAITAVGEGYADDVPLEDIARFERELLEYVRVNYPQLSSAVMAGEKLSRQQQEQLRENIVRFKKVFR